MAQPLQLVQAEGFAHVAVGTAINQRGHRIVALSFLSAQLPRFNTLATGDWTAGLELRRFEDVPALVAAAGGKLWSPHFNDLTQALMQRARAEGLRVIPWTVNEPTDMERLIDWGVDGLITDHPDRLRQVMQQRGMALPPALEPTVAARTRPLS